MTTLSYLAVPRETFNVCTISLRITKLELQDLHMCQKWSPSRYLKSLKSARTSDIFRAARFHDPDRFVNLSEMALVPYRHVYEPEGSCAHFLRTFPAHIFAPACVLSLQRCTPLLRAPHRCKDASFVHLTTAKMHPLRLPPRLECTQKARTYYEKALAGGELLASRYLEDMQRLGESADQAL